MKSLADVMAEVASQEFVKIDDEFDAVVWPEADGWYSWGDWNYDEESGPFRSRAKAIAFQREWLASLELDKLDE